MDDSERFLNIERDIADLRDRMGQVESSTKGAWKTLGETKDDVGNLYDDVDELRRDVKEVMTKQTTMEIDMKDIKVNQSEIQRTQVDIQKSLKWVIRGLVILGAIVLIAGVIAYSNGSDVPQKTAEALIPILEKLI